MDKRKKITAPKKREKPRTSLAVLVGALKTAAKHRARGYVDHLAMLLLVGICAALVFAVLAHTRRDDELRRETAECREAERIERSLADACTAVVRRANAAIDEGACACWMPGEVKGKRL